MGEVGVERTADVVLVMSVAVVAGVEDNVAAVYEEDTHTVCAGSDGGVEMTIVCVVVVVGADVGVVCTCSLVCAPVAEATDAAVAGAVSAGPTVRAVKRGVVAGEADEETTGERRDLEGVAVVVGVDVVTGTDDVEVADDEDKAEAESMRGEGWERVGDEGEDTSAAREDDTQADVRLRTNEGEKRSSKLMARWAVKRMVL